MKRPAYQPVNGLLCDQQQQRITQKSDALLQIEARQARMQARSRSTAANADPAFDDSLLPALLRRQGA